MKNLFTTYSKDSLQNFEKIKEIELKDYNGKGILYRHKQTHMEVFHLENQDEELFASFCFKTLPFDSTGVFHIIEHTVLSGSKKVPVRDPFSQMTQGSVNSYLNAYTTPYCTCFPFASPLKKDFDNIFYVYSDSVFSPLLRKVSFESEGIRQIGTKENGKMAGVVFNEMQGDYSDQEAVVSKFSTSSLFKGSCFENDSGGDIQEIPTLSFESYLETYKKWYHPSNCYLFIYGKLDIRPYLSYLDQEYLKDKQFKAIEKQKEISSLTSPVSYSVPGPKARKSNISLNWAVSNSADPLQVLILNIIVDLLLGNPGALLYRAVTESELGEDLSSESGMTASFRQMVFSVGFSGAERENSKKIEDFFMETLKKIVEDSIDSQTVETSLKSIEFSFLENARSNNPFGYEACKRSLRGWMFEGNPFDVLQKKKTFETLKKKLSNEKDFFGRWIKENLIENPQRVLLTVYPDENFNKNLEESIHSLLKEQTQEESENKEKEIQIFSSKEEDEEALKSVPFLTREDIPLSLHPYPHEKTTFSSRPLTLQNLRTNGICYFSIGLNTVDLNEEEHMLLPLLITLLQMTGVDDLDYTQVALRLRFLTGASSFSLLNGRKIKTKKPYSILNIYAKTLIEDSKPALSFISHLFQKGDLTSSKRINSAITDLVTSFSSEFTQNVIFYAASRAGFGFSPFVKEKELTNGISQGEYLKNLSKCEIKVISQKLENLRQKLVDKNRIQCQITTDEKLMKKAKEALKLFIDSFESKGKKIEINKEFYKFQEIETKTEAYFFDSPLVSYNAFTIPLKFKDLLIKQATTILSKVLSTGILWDKIRSIGGAYAAGASFDAQEGLMTFYSYRDPHIGQTRDAFKEVLEAIAKNGIDAKQLEKNILSLVGLELRPKSSEAESMTVWILELYGYSQEYRDESFKKILQITVEDVKKAAKYIVSQFDKGKFVTIAKKELLEKNNIEEPYQEIVF
ncbi:MAG: insulinase family protein [Sphaerochaetaceae bacterium]|nr:insulinase family protein [Sphaerochaetaceae bacterium]